MLAVGILGATVMPHVVYLHSALTSQRIQPRDTAEKRELLRFQRLDVAIAMTLAGIINLTMLIVAAALFHTSGATGVDSIEGAHAEFTRCSAAAWRSPSPSRCWRPACRARASARSPARS